MTVSVTPTKILSPEPADLASQGLGGYDQNAETPGLYLDLLKRTLANIIYQDVPLMNCEFGKGPEVAKAFDLRRRVVGEDMPSQAHTMVGVRRLENIQFCVEQALRDGVPGDLIEMGVASGGSAIFMRGVLKAHRCVDRRVFAADAFADPPKPLKPHQIFVAKWVMWCLASIPIRAWQRKLCEHAARNGKSFPEPKGDNRDVMEALLWFLKHLDIGYAVGLRTGLANVQAYFARYGLLDEQVCFLPGFFADTLPQAPIDKVAVMRLDGDLYESTMDGLRHIYPKLSPGGFCIIDDYYAFASCARAVDEYRTEQGILEPLQPVDRLAVFWRKA
jgi:O-methyltransferase